MKKLYMATLLLLATSLSVGAQDAPVAPGGDQLTDGNTYTFFCYSKLAGQMIRTSWDGAIYSPGSGTSAFTVKLTAQENDDKTWSFYYDDETTEGTVRYYMNIPSGTGNVNVKATERCDWNISEGQYEGFYFVAPGAGNNSSTFGYNMHMNAGNEYVVSSFYGDGWYPDFYGGVLQDEYGDNVYISDDPDENRVVMADSSSCNWAFVEVDNVPAFLEKADLFAFINNYYKAYVTVESPEDGFVASYNAALALYDKGNVKAEDIDALKAILNNKVALYNEIKKYENDEDVQTALSNEVLAALTAFDEETDADKVAAALETFAKAVADFKLGLGDVTAMGQNMSFEDLSAQGGSTTSSVQGAPAGWNVYINGKQVTTADEVRSAGITAWHGQNEDGTGAKDGNNIFGIWNGSIPQYEISQTIEGMENGTYTITAALMVGANGSGSRRTTQRIFGNLSSTYFGMEDEYNLELLDLSEVYGFQGNSEPQTDTELQPISVKAYVFDGTLTFGVRTDANYAAAMRTEGNGAGGDGWFKVDNFRIHKEGYNVDDALEVLDFFRSSLEEIVTNGDKKVYANVRDVAEQLLARTSSITASDEPVLINGSIMALHDVISSVADAARAYDKLGNAIANAYENLAKYDSKAGAGEYADVIMAVEEKWENEEYNSEAEIDAAIQELADALQACKESDTIEAGDDLTEYLKNPSFEDLSSQNGNNSDGPEGAPAGWHLFINGTEVFTSADTRAAGQNSWCAINRGDNLEVEFEGETYTHQYTDGEHLWGVWADNVPTVEIYQELTLPAGIYQLTADVVVQHDWGGMNITTQRIFGNESVQMYGRDYDYGENFTPDMLDAQTLQQYNTNEQITYFSYAGYDNDVSYDYTSLARPMSLNFRVGEDGKAKIGFRTNNVDASGTEHPHACAGWFKLDNFRLSCLYVGLVPSPELPEGIEELAAENAGAAIYDLAGRKVSKLVDKGVYIQNGKKLLVK